MNIRKTKSTIYLLLITIGFFLFLEGVSYFLIAKYAETGTFSDRQVNSIFHPFRGWVTPKNAKIKVSKPFFGFREEKFVETDNNGRVITPLDLARPRLKIAILGGSSVFGVGATSNAANVASQLEYILYHEQGIRSEVTNLAVRGYNSFQELVTLREFFLTNNVDLVIALTGFNDAKIAFDNDDIKYSLLPRQVFSVSVPLVRKAQRQQPILLNPEGFLRQSSFFDLGFRALYRLVGQPNELKSTEFPPDFGSIEDKVLITRDNYAMMKALSESRGAKFILALQPTAYHLPNYPADIDYLKKNLVSHDVRRKYIVKFFEHLALKSIDLDLIDLRFTLDNHKDKPYVDSIHYTDSAATSLGLILSNEAIAVFAKIKEKNLLLYKNKIKKE